MATLSGSRFSLCSRCSNEIRFVNLILQPFDRLTSLIFLILLVQSISCYVCTSINGTNPACEDTFMATDRYYMENCRNRRHRRTGTFPSQYCVKFEAEDMEDSNYTVMVRDCAVDDGGVNVDTEIGRISHCGWVQHVYYNGRYMRGCVSACRADGCNEAVSVVAPASLLLLIGPFLHLV